MATPCVLELQEMGQVWRCVRRTWDHRTCDEWERVVTITAQESFANLNGSTETRLSYPCGTQFDHEPHKYVFYGTPPNTLGEPFYCDGSIRETP